MANSFRRSSPSIAFIAPLLVVLTFAEPASAQEWAQSAARWFSPRYAALETQQRTLHEELVRLPHPPVSQQSERIGWHSQFAQNPSATKWLQVDLGSAQLLDSVTLVPVDVAYGTYPGPGFGFPVRFRVEVSDEAAFSEPRLLAAFDGEDFPNPGIAPVFLPTPGAVGRYIRVTATRLWPRGDLALLALGEVFVLRNNLNLAAGAPVTVSDAYNNPPAWQPPNATDGQSVLGAPVEVMPTPGNGYHARTVKTEMDTVKWVQVDLGQSLKLDEVRLYPARPKDFPARRGFGFPVRFRVEAADEARFAHPQILLDCTHADFENPAENPVVIPSHGVSAQFVRVTATRLWARTNDYIFALAELEVWSNGENVARSSKVTGSDAIEAASWASRFLIDGFNSQGRIVPLGEWLRGLSRRREVEGELTRLSVEEGRLMEETRRAGTCWGFGLVASLVAAVVIGLRRRARARRRELDQLRQRLAGDLHDEIGSNLGSIALLSQMALRQPGHAEEDLAEIHRVARESADSMRDLVWFIKPSALAAGDFVAKLRETAATMLTGLEWTFEGSAPAEQWSLDFKRQIFLIFKEALHNVRRHASAQSVSIHFGAQQGSLELIIADDGCGFSANDNAGGHGLASMRQRAEALGGTLLVESSAGAGTRVMLTVKLTSQYRAIRA